MDCCIRSYFCICLIVIVLFVVLGGLIVGLIVAFGRTMSPKGAILPHSPGREPWVNHCNTFIEPRRGGTSARVLGVVVMLYCIYSLRHLLAKVSAAPTELLILLFSVYPGFHIGLCPHFTLGFAGVPPFQGSLESETT